jgi:ubiquinone/menaquinone biosynthesis C-methylase UbiE
MSAKKESVRVNFCCPICNSVLRRSNRVLLCSGCSAKWPVENGIPRFIKDGFYWGFTARDTMLQILEIAESEGWAKGVDYYVAVTHPTEDSSYRDYVVNEARANWRFLLSLSSDSKVLDIGSDWGCTSIALSRVAGEVAAIDATYENLQFIDIRCRQENITNVTPVNADIVHYPHLPFPDNYFNLVAMIGILRWIGDAQPEVNAMETQKSALNKIWRVLKSDGKLYLAIENRFGFTYCLGKPEEHTGLRFITMLPRSLANVYSRIARKKPYRAYTYSMNGLRHLLRDSGFSRTEFYFPILHYANPRYYVSLESPEPPGYLISHILQNHPKMNPVAHGIGRLAIQLGFHRLFCPTFAVIAEK